MSAYLRAREMAEPAKALRKRDKVIADWTTLKVQTALGVQFRHGARVRLRQPWWMPGPLYRVLMRSIIVDYRAEERTQKGPKA